MKVSFHERKLVGLMLTFLGGAMDGYTYFHYDVFASAQTGNLVLAVIQGSNGQWGHVLQKLMSTLFFFAGILLAKFLIAFFDEKEIYYWRLFILFYEAIIFALLGLDVINVHPVLVTVMISFSASIQWIAFDKINGRAYTNLFTTGNLKGMTTNFYDYVIAKKEGGKEGFFHYLEVVLSFLLGVVVIVTFYHLFSSKAIYLIALGFLYLALSQSYFVWRFFKEEGLPLKTKKWTDR